MNFRIAIVLGIVLVVAGCINRGGYYKDDGPPRRAKVDVSRVPDAVPRREPLSKTGNRPYSALGQVYRPVKSARGYRERGVASWYGKKFHGKRTSSGEPYDMYAMTAAHRTLPLPSYVRVRNRHNGKTVVVRVNDRGPFLRDRIIDLSYAAAYRLGIVGHGTGSVEVEAIMPGEAKTVSVAVPAPVTEKVVRPVLSQVFIQVGAFSDPANAQALRNRLIGAGFHPVAIDIAPSDALRVYRVRVGPLPSVLEAEHELVRLNDTYADTPRIIVE